MLGGDETTDDPVVADTRNFYKVELWTHDDQIERMLFAGTSLDRARRRLRFTRPRLAERLSSSPRPQFPTRRNRNTL
jgi:hypothetical protein